MYNSSVRSHGSQLSGRIIIIGTLIHWMEDLQAFHWCLRYRTQCSSPPMGMLVMFCTATITITTADATTIKATIFSAPVHRSFGRMFHTAGFRAHTSGELIAPEDESRSGMNNKTLLTPMITFNDVRPNGPLESNEPTKPTVAMLITTASTTLSIAVILLTLSSNLYRGTRGPPTPPPLGKRAETIACPGMKNTAGTASIMSRQRARKKMETITARNQH